MDNVCSLLISAQKPAIVSFKKIILKVIITQQYGNAGILLSLYISSTQT
jgi:hypothetical protein